MRGRNFRAAEIQMFLILTFALVLVIFGTAAAFSGYGAPTNGVWFNRSWNYRIRVEINTTSANVTDWPIEIAINFSDVISEPAFIP